MIPAFIINYNRLTLPAKMAEFLSKNKNVDVYIIDKPNLNDRKRKEIK